MFAVLHPRRPVVADRRLLAGDGGAQQSASSNGIMDGIRTVRMARLPNCPPPHDLGRT